MNNPKPNFMRFIFSCSLILNAILFVLVLPAFIYACYSRSLPSKELFRTFIVLVFCLVLILNSFSAFYKGIDTSSMEGRMTRYGIITDANKEFFAFFSKPIAFIIQFLSLFFLIFTLIEFYK